MTTLLQARLDSALPPLVQDPAGPPSDIQWMPPGQHKIVPHVDGKPRPVTITVDRAFADQVAAQVREMRARADRAEGDLPYLDFNHEDGPAAGHVTELYWAGEDPKTGGIRAKVQWTEGGLAALKGRSFRRFSPQWLSDPQSLAPMGVGENLGGLVNRAAFQTIQPVVAKRGDHNHHIMTEAEKSELNQLITGAMKPISDRLTALETKSAELVTAAGAAAKAALAGVETRLQAVESAGSDRAKTEAKSRVAAAVTAGRISPQDTKAIEFWEGALVTNASAGEQLDRLPINPAFLKITQGANGGAPNPGTPAPDTAEGFAAVVKASYADGKTTRGEALTKAIAAHPTGYDAWRKANGKPGL